MWCCCRYLSSLSLLKFWQLISKNFSKHTCLWWETMNRFPKYLNIMWLNLTLLTHSQFEHAILVALHFPQWLVHKCDGRLRRFLQSSKGLIKRWRVSDACPCGALHRSDSALKYASSFVQKVRALDLKKTLDNRKVRCSGHWGNHLTLFALSFSCLGRIHKFKPEYKIKGFVEMNFL